MIIGKKKIQMHKRSVTVVNEEYDYNPDVGK
jgi:hypothetical protein